MIIKYDPIKPTDWLTPLEKVYARQSAQLDRLHSQLRERDRQEQEAAYTAEKFNRDLLALGSFSNTIKQISDARKVEHDTKERDGIKKRLNTPEKSKEYLDIIEPYKFNKKGFNDDWKALEQDFRASTKFSVEEKDYFLAKSPRRLLLAKEIEGQRIVKGLPQAWNYAINNEGKWQDEYRKAVAANDTAAVLQLRENFHSEKLNNYKYSNGFLFENIKKENDRILRTGVTLDKIKAKNIKLTTEEVQFQTDLQTVLESGTPEQIGDTVLDGYLLDKAWLASNAEAYETAVQQGTEKFVFTYEKFLYKSKDPIGDLDKILNSTVSHAGTEGGVATLEKGYLNEDQVKKLTIAANKGLTLRWEENKAAKKLEQQKTLLDIENNPENWTQDKIDQEILRLENSSYADTTLLRELKEKDLLATDQDIAAQEAEDWEILNDNGSLLSKANIDAAKLIKNETIKRRITKRQKDLKLSYRKNLMDDYDTRKIQNGRDIIKKSGKGTLGDQEYDLGGWPGRLQTKLTGLEAKIYQDLYDKNPDDTTIAGQVVDEIERIKTKNGWYAKPGDPDEGIWTFDEKGNLTNLKNSIKARNLRLANWDLVEAKEFTNPNKINAWDNSIINAEKTAVTVYSPGQTFEQKLINTPNLLEEDDIIAPIQFGWERSVGGNQFKITSKTGYIASRIPNVTRVELWKAQANLLINSDDPKHKELVKIYDLKKAVKEVKDPQRTLIEFAEQTGDKYLENAFKTNPEQVSPKQWNRFLSNLPLDYAEEERYLTLKANYPELRDLSNEEIDQILESINKNKKEKELQLN